MQATKMLSRSRKTCSSARAADALRIAFQEAAGHGCPPSAKWAGDTEGVVMVRKNGEATELPAGEGGRLPTTDAELPVLTSARQEGEAMQEMSPGTIGTDPVRRPIGGHGELEAFFMCPPLSSRAEERHMSPGHLLVSTAAGIGFPLFRDSLPTGPGLE